MISTDYRTLTTELETLRGIRRVLVETRDGRIKTIHVESDLSRRAKSISADIQSKLAFLGIPLDYKKISIIEPKESRIGSDRVPISRINAAPPARIILKQVTANEDPSGAIRAVSVLLLEGRQFTGTYNGPGAAEMAVALSMVNAFEPLVAPHTLVVESVKIDSALDTLGIILTLRYADKREETLTGMVKISDNVSLAAAKAFLAATNRRVEHLLA